MCYLQITTEVGYQVKDWGKERLHEGIKDRTCCCGETGILGELKWEEMSEKGKGGTMGRTTNTKGHLRNQCGNLLL